MSETLVVINPAARRGRLGELWPELEPRVKAALQGASLRVERTSERDHGSGLVRAALRSGVRRMVVVGGDGTLSEALNGLFEEGVAGAEPRLIAKDVEVGVIPAGRGDDFFKMLSPVRGGDVRGRALEILGSGKSRNLDLGRVELLDAGGNVQRVRHFVNIASFGYPGLVVRRVFDESGMLGKTWLGRSAWAYLYQSAGALLSYKPISVAVKLDGREFYSGPLFSGFVLNGAYNAGGVRWSSEARMDDGVFHLTLVEPRGLLDTLSSSGRMLSGEWKGAPGAHVGSGVEVEIRQTSPVDGRRHPLFEIDGDLPEAPGCMGARIRCLPGVARLLG